MNDPNTITKSFPMIIVKKLWNLRYKKWKTITLGTLFLSPLQNIPLGVNGSTRLNTRMMAPLIDIKSVLLQRNILYGNILIGSQIKLVTVRVLLVMAVTYNWSLLQLDVNNAFLHSDDLFEEVFMKLPLGYKPQTTYTHSQKLVCRLKKSIYGLKQSSR